MAIRTGFRVLIILSLATAAHMVAAGEPAEIVEAVAKSTDEIGFPFWNKPLFAGADSRLVVVDHDEKLGWGLWELGKGRQRRPLLAEGTAIIAGLDEEMLEGMRGKPRGLLTTKKLVLGRPETLGGLVVANGKTYFYSEVDVAEEARGAGGDLGRICRLVQAVRDGAIEWTWFDRLDGLVDGSLMQFAVTPDEKIVCVDYDFPEDLMICDPKEGYVGAIEFKARDIWQDPWRDEQGFSEYKRRLIARGESTESAEAKVDRLRQRILSSTIRRQKKSEERNGLKRTRANAEFGYIQSLHWMPDGSFVLVDDGQPTWIAADGRILRERDRKFGYLKKLYFRGAGYGMVVALGVMPPGWENKDPERFEVADRYGFTVFDRVGRVAATGPCHEYIEGAYVIDARTIITYETAVVGPRLHVFEIRTQEVK